jgi:hypothetical protein
MEGHELIYDEFFYAEDHEYIYNEFVNVKNSNTEAYIVIIPADKIKGKEKEGHLKFQNELKEMQKNGYVYSNIEDPREIFSIQYKGSSEYPFRHFRVSEIELGFPYKGLDFVEEKNNLGYYNLWPYNDEKGWIGIGQFFMDPKLGICNYERRNVRLEEGTIRLIAEDISYEINHKPTSYIVKGSDEVGYFAYLDWYDDTYRHNLQCGTEKYDPNYLIQVMALAIKIDQVK